MAKILRLLSIASISISVPLILVSCSSGVTVETSVIQIDRVELEKNFPKTASNIEFNTHSVDKFITDFNDNPQNYFKSSVVTSNSAVPFITAKIESFSENKINDTFSKPKISAEKISNIPSFITVKFTFELKREFKPEVVIQEAPGVTLDPLETSVFSMDFRILTPTIGSAERPIEIDWIKGFFAENFFSYLSEKIKRETRAKTPRQITNEIVDRNEFEKVFRMNIAFPSESVTGWNYDVVAKINPQSSTSVIFEFTLTNSVFKDANALTPEEAKVELIVNGFTEEK
ncbi:MAG: hypothetical protein ACRC1F_00370 [Metamycoplasmataceae bacterium]